LPLGDMRSRSLHDVSIERRRFPASII
jgi:hypothetical protein